MKKIILLSAFVVMAIALSGQSRWAFGLDVEAGYSGQADLQEQTYYDDTFGDYYYKTEVRRQPGFSGGVWTEFLLSHRFSLRLGVNYSQWRNFSESESISYNTEDVMISYNRERYYQKQSQLRIPLETHFYFGKPDSRTRFFLKSGIQAGYLLSQNNMVNSYYGAAGQPDSYGYSYGEKVDLSAEWLDVKRWQTSFIGGLGVTIDRATLSLQKSWGLNKKDDYYYGGYPYGGCCGFGLCDCYLPHYGSYGIRQLEQTTLRFAYTIW